MNSKLHIAGLIAGSVLGAGRLAAQAPPSKQELLVAWQANWAGVTDLEVTYQILSTGPQQQMSAGVIPVAEQLFRWGEGRFYGRYTRPGGATKHVSYDFIADDGRLRYGGNAWHGQGYFDGSPGSWMSNQLRALGPEGSTSWAWTSDLSAMLSADNTALRPQTEEIEGHATAVLDVPEGDYLMMTIWLDIERSGVPLRWWRYDASGQLFVAVDLHEYIQVSSATWLATNIDYAWMGGDVAGVITSQRVVPDAQGQLPVAINSGIGPEELTVQFPNNTLVVDVDTGEMMQVVASTGSPAEFSARLAEAVEGHKCTRAFARAGGPRDAWTRRPVLGFLAVGLLLGAALRFWRA